MSEELNLALIKQKRAMGLVKNLVINLRKTGRDNINPTTIQKRLSMWRELNQDIYQRDAELELMATEEDRDHFDYFRLDHIEDYQADSMAVQDELDALLVSFGPAAHHSVTASAAQSVPMEPAIPLPRVDLPKYGGAILEWPAFRDQFTALIIRNQRLSDVQRLHYLFSALTGEAKTAIKHLDVCDDNFAAAWEVLLNRFENERELVFANIERLFGVAAAKPNSAEAIRMLREEVSAVRHSLTKLHRDMAAWNDIFVYVVMTRLDGASREAWETVTSASTKVPEYQQLDKFLDSRSRVLRAVTPTPAGSVPSHRDNRRVDARPNSQARPNRIAALTVQARPLDCVVCHQPHAIYRCPTFATYSSERRARLIADAGRCYNCFSSAHRANQCTSLHRCKRCDQKHHTLLHTESPGGEPSTRAAPAASIAQVASNHVACTNRVTVKRVMLATARVQCYSPHGRSTIVRALLDQGSEATLISEKLVQLLRLQRVRALTIINGAADASSIAKSVVEIALGSTQTIEPTVSVNAVVVASVAKLARDRAVEPPSLSHLRGIQWADVDPFSDDPIDVLIGADLYSAVFRDGIKRGHPHEPMAQETIFGWIITGPLSHGSVPATINTHVVSLTALDRTLRKFWEIEAIPHRRYLSEEEEQCERHFLSTHSRDEEGRYTVRLPFRTTVPRFGNTRDIALAGLRRLE